MLLKRCEFNSNWAFSQTIKTNLWCKGEIVAFLWKLKWTKTGLWSLAGPAETSAENNQHHARDKAPRLSQAVLPSTQFTKCDGHGTSFISICLFVRLFTLDVSLSGFFKHSFVHTSRVDILKLEVVPCSFVHHHSRGWSPVGVRCGSAELAHHSENEFISLCSKSTWYPWCFTLTRTPSITLTHGAILTSSSPAPDGAEESRSQTQRDHAQVKHWKPLMGFISENIPFQTNVSIYSVDFLECKCDVSICYYYWTSPLVSPNG